MPGKPHGQRSLAGYRPKACNESDTQQLQIEKAKLLVTVVERLRFPIFCSVSSNRTEALYKM